MAKRWKTWFELLANLISTKVSARHRKCTQALAKRSGKQTKVLNLQLLAIPIGQGFKIASLQLSLSPGQMESQVDASWTPFDQVLRALALTCGDLRSLWSRSNLHASQSKFVTVWPPNPSQRKLNDVHKPMEMEDSLPWNVFATCVYFRGNSRVRWPPNASLYASSTCVHLGLLAGPFDQAGLYSLYPFLRLVLCMDNYAADENIGAYTAARSYELYFRVENILFL